MANYDMKNKAKSLVTLAEGEVVIKNYHCMNMFDRRKNGYVCVSNKRVFMLETSIFNNSVRKSEVPIENISGINSTYYRAPLLGRILLAVLLFGIAILSLWLAASRSLDLPGWLKVIFYVIAVIFALFGLVVAVKCRRRELCMTIYTKTAFGTFMTVNNFAKSEEKALSSWRFRGTKQCFDMISEIGALILDVQTYGKEIAPKYFSKAEAKKDKMEKIRVQAQDDSAKKEAAKKAQLEAQRKAEAEAKAKVDAKAKADAEAKSKAEAEISAQADNEVKH